MRVIVGNPGEAPKVRNILGNLASLQACVGGTLEHFASEGPVDFLANEEGHINGMAFNRVVRSSNGSLWAICGPLLVLGADREAGEFRSLTVAESEHWLAWLRGKRRDLRDWLVPPENA